MSYAPLDQWNDEYSTQLRAAGSTSDSDWKDSVGFKMKLFNDVGDITYGDKVLTVKDYTDSSETPTNGKPHENSLVWDDSTGGSESKGNIQFTTYKELKIFKGTITLKNASGTMVTQQICGTQGKDKAPYSVVDIFVITGTVIAGFMMIAAIPLIKKGVEKGALEWKKMAGTATAHDLGEYDRLAHEVRRQEFHELASRLSALELPVPKDAAQLDALGDAQHLLAQQLEASADAVRLTAVDLETRIERAEAEIEEARIYVENIATHLHGESPQKIAEEKSRLQERIEHQRDLNDIDRRKRDSARTEQRDFERQARERKRIGDLAKRLA